MTCICGPAAGREKLKTFFRFMLLFDLIVVSNFLAEFSIFSYFSCNIKAFYSMEMARPTPVTPKRRIK